MKFLEKHSRTIELILVVVALCVSLWVAKMSRDDAYMQVQTSILNEFRGEFEDLQHARFVASNFALNHIEEHNISLSEVPPEVWQVMDFFDRVSIYSDRDYVNKEMTFVSFYYWMYPYYTFYHEEVSAFKDRNSLAMYDSIPKQLDVLKAVSISNLGKTERDFKTPITPEKIREFFTLECKETRPEEPSPSAAIQVSILCERSGSDLISSDPKPHSAFGKRS
jgi:hypothetical protein